MGRRPEFLEWILKKKQVLCGQVERGRTVEVRGAAWANWSAQWSGWIGGCRRPWEVRGRRPPAFMFLMGNNLPRLPPAVYRKLQSWGEVWQRKNKTKRRLINSTLAVGIDGVWEVTDHKDSDAGTSDPWDVGGKSGVHRQESQESHLVRTCLCKRPKTETCNSFG